MHIIANILLLFVYIFGLFYFGLPNIFEITPIKNKLILFIAVFIGQFMLLTFSTIKAGEVVNMNSVIIDSLFVAGAGVIGYSIYNDRYYLDRMPNWVDNKETLYHLYATLLVMVFISCVKFTQLLIKN